MAKPMNRQPTYFISHGGGPWPFMKAEYGTTFDILEASLRDMPRQLAITPKAIIMVSAHWEEDQPTVMAHPHPPMLYDYEGFPAHTYQVKYASPGFPELAGRIQKLLTAAGHPTQLDHQRGLDHGAFVPLVPMYPEANVPVVQLSICRGYDPSLHVAIGRALAPLRDEGMLIIGSGLSYHNLRLFGPQGQQPSREFDNWLAETLLKQELNQRRQRLLNWEKAPSAQAAHPQADHLIPLMVAFGAAENEAATRVYYENSLFGSVTVSSYRFG